MLRLCWIDVYLNFFDYIYHDANKNFINRKFRQYCSIINIVIKSMFVKIHWSIEIVEKYHSMFCRAYLMIMKDLIVIDTSTSIIKKTGLQIAVKAVNNIADNNDLIFTLLMFGAYFRMQKFDSSFSIIIQRIDAIKKTMKKIRIIKTEKQISDALNIRNKSITNYFHDLSLNSKILIWREKSSNRSNKWIKSFNFWNMKNEICKIEMFYDFIEFKNTMIKSYYQISIENNENTNIVSNDEQMFSNENELSNDKKVIEQFLKFQNTKISAIISNAVISNAIISNAIISNANAFNATAAVAFNQAKSEKTSQLEWPQG